MTPFLNTTQSKAVPFGRRTFTLFRLLFRQNKRLSALLRRGFFVPPKNKFKKKIKKKVAKQKNGLSLWGHKAQDDQHYLTFLPTYLCVSVFLLSLPTPPLLPQ
ncbi:MAG: hypothetical protein ACK528_01290 [Alphaproteobacteria bacterium]